MPTPQEQLASLQAERDALLVKADIRQIELALSHVSGDQRDQRMNEGFGDYVDPQDHLYDTPGFGTRDYRISLGGDRDRGDNAPFWVSEQEHAETRGIARYLHTVDEIGISAMTNLTNYVIGTGFTYAAEPRSRDASQLARACDSIWQTFDEANSWAGDLEREFFWRTHRDGEAFLHVYGEDGEIVVDVIEPEFITEPARPDELEEWKGLPWCDWKYGIATKYNKTARREAYFVEWFGKANEWDVLLSESVIASKVNVDRTVKRGLSDYYAVYQQLERASKLLGNTLQGAAIQACIAYIRKHAAGTSESQIASLSGGDYSYNRPTAGGNTTTVKVKKFLPGTVIDTAGSDYLAGPMGTPQGPTYVQIVQAALRYVGSRWAMPEYMISGDASNGNFASTLVSEAPFTKNCEAMQSVAVRDYKQLWWRVMQVACRLGRFQRYGINSVAELRQFVECQITPPEVAVRNRYEEAQTKEIEYRSGVLSAETWAEETGRDPAQEKQRGAKPVDVGVGLPTPTISKPSPGGEPDPAAQQGAKKMSDLAMNGAQVTAASSIVQSVADGAMPRDSGLSQLQKFFNLSQSEAEMIMGSAGTSEFAPKKNAPSITEAWKGYP